MKLRLYKCKTKRWFRKYIKLMETFNLYLGSWSGYGELIYDNFNFEKITHMAMLKLDNKPIGVSIKLSGSGMYGCNITCYVKDEYRRRGHGSKLVNALISRDEIDNDQFPENFPK